MVVEGGAFHAFVFSEWRQRVADLGGLHEFPERRGDGCRRGDVVLLSVAGGEMVGGLIANSCRLGCLDGQLYERGAGGVCALDTYERWPIEPIDAHYYAPAAFSADGSLFAVGTDWISVYRTPHTALETV
jgi:hypothetical protein